MSNFVDSHRVGSGGGGGGGAMGAETPLQVNEMCNIHFGQNVSSQCKLSMQRHIHFFKIWCTNNYLALTS